MGNPHCPSLACAPTFERNPLKRVLAPRNGRVVIKCRPKAAPKPSFTWSKDTELLSNSTRSEETFSHVAVIVIARGQRSGLFSPTKVVTVVLNPRPTCYSGLIVRPRIGCSIERLCSPSGYCCIALHHQQAPRSSPCIIQQAGPTAHTLASRQKLEFYAVRVFFNLFFFCGSETHLGRTDTRVRIWDLELITPEQRDEASL